MSSVESEPEEKQLANLTGVMFKRLDIQSEAEEEEDEVDMEEHSSQDDKGSNMGGMTGDESNMEGEDKSQLEGEVAEKKKKSKKNELEIECKVLITCGH